MKTLVRTLQIAALVAAAIAGSAPHAAAQSTVPEPGEGTVSLTTQYYRHSGHFDKNGNANTNGPTRSQVLITQVDVGLRGAFGLNVSLPFIASKYVGPSSYFVEGHEVIPGPLDDYSYHGAFQDVRVEARRTFLFGAVAAAPFISGSVPTHNYQTQGEAVPGRHRRELQAGVSASADLDALIPRLSISGRYAYATLQKINGFPHTRSNIDLEGDYQLTSRIGIRSMVGWQIRHAGPTIPELLPDWPNHDRFINSSFLDVGGGASFSLSRRTGTEIYGIFAGTVRGDHGAHIARIIAIGVSRSFGGGFRSLGNN